MAASCLMAAIKEGVSESLQVDASSLNMLFPVEGFKWKYTPLTLACARGHNNVVSELVSCKDIDVNCPSEFGSTPLVLAAQAGHAGIVRLLLAHPAIDVNAVDTKVNSALIHAAAKGKAEVVEALLAVPHIALNAFNSNSHSALLLAAVNGHANVVEKLLERDDIDVNLPDKGGNSPLMLAAATGTVSIVDVLVKHRAIQIDRANKYGDTALHRACKEGHDAIIPLLYPQSHSDLVKNGDGFTPYDLAFHRHHWKVIVALIARGFHDWEIHPHHEASKLLLECLAADLSIDVAVTMVLRDLPLEIQDQDVVIPRPAHQFSWTTFLESHHVPLSIRLAVVKKIGDLYVDAPSSFLRGLALALNLKGSVAFESTDASTRDILQSWLHFCGRYELNEGGPPCHVSPSSVLLEAIDHGYLKQLFDEYAANDTGLLNATGFATCLEHLETFWGISPSTVMPPSQPDEIHLGEFQRLCRSLPPFRIVLKWMRDNASYTNEITLRQGLDAQSVLSLVPTTVPLSEFHTHASSIRLEHFNLLQFPFVAVLPLASRDLAAICRHECPTTSEKHRLAFEVALALHRLHARGLAHGNISSRHVVRFNRHLRFIDLSHAGPVGDDAKAKDLTALGYLFVELLGSVCLSMLDVWEFTLQNCIADENARDLIRRLVTQPSTLDAHQVLQHPFFSHLKAIPTLIPAQNAKELQTTFNSNQILARIHTVIETKALFGAGFTNRLSVPSSLLVLPFELDAVNPQERFEKLQAYLLSLSAVANALQHGESTLPTSVFDQIVSPQDPLFVYLLDEVTGSLVVDIRGVYPLPLVESHIFLALHFPLILAGLRMLERIHPTPDTFAQAVGLQNDFPIQDLKDSIAQLPVVSYDILACAAKYESFNKKTMERTLGDNLEQLFDEFDVAHTFGGLCRVITPSQVVWTLRIPCQMSKQQMNRLRTRKLPPTLGEHWKNVLKSSSRPPPPDEERSCTCHVM
ncbi:unnamed protein product [Aphanomyces euteiches]